MSMEFEKIFLKPEQFEREGQEKEAITDAEEEAKRKGKPFGVLNKEITRLETKRKKVASILKAISDIPVLKELDAQIERLKKAEEK